MPLYLLYCRKDHRQELFVYGLVTSKDVADEFVRSKKVGVDYPYYLEVSPDMYFYRMRLDMSDGPEFQTFFQAPITFTPSEVRMEAERQAPLLIEQYIKSREMEGQWSAETWKILDIRQGH